MLKAINLKCVRGELCLFTDLSLHLEAGECLLVHGENGAGKTSLLRILVGLMSPMAGSMYWKGRSIKPLDDEYRREVLYLGHSLALKEELSPMENLAFSAAVANESADASAVRKALHRVGLQGKEALPARMLSQGQKRRVNLARLLLQERTVWVLDEPLTALDVNAAQQVTQIIDQHLADGGITILTSHQDIKLAHAAQLIHL